MQNGFMHSDRSIREEGVSSFIELISSSAGSPTNLTRMLSSLTNCITSRTAFGKRNKQQDTFEPVSLKIVQVLGGFSIVDVFPSLKSLFVITGLRHKVMRIHEEANMILETSSMNTKQGGPQTQVIPKLKHMILLMFLLNLQDDGNLEF